MLELNYFKAVSWARILGQAKGFRRSFKGTLVKTSVSNSILKQQIARVFILAAFCLAFSNCTKVDSNSAGGAVVDSTVVAKGTREFGIDILDTTAASDFANNIRLAKEAGASYIILGLAWNAIESSTPSDCNSAGSYTDPGNALQTFNSLLPASGLGMSLSILPTSTNINTRPSNLATTNFDDALLVCRYQKMLQFVFSKIPNLNLVSIQFGNEIDAYPTANQVSFWSQYWSFFVQVSASAKALRANVKTSMVATLYGAAGLSSNSLAKGGLQQIYNNADIVVVTYYPMNTDFTVKNPAVIESEIAELVKLYPSKPIYFNEIGFHSGSSLTGSSELMQREFVTQVFKVWDKYPSEISKISFLRLNDLTASKAQSVAGDYGMSGNASFVEYIQTLGLRTDAGADKLGFLQLKSETKSRGW